MCFVTNLHRLRHVSVSDALIRPGRAVRSAAMIDGDPGTAFSDEVVVRRLRFTSEDSGFAVIDADRGGDDVVLVGTIAHLEERERVRIEGIWQDDRRFGMQVKVRLAAPVAPSGEEALIAYLKRVKHIGGGRAARLRRALRGRRAGDDRRRSRGRVPRCRVEPEAGQRGDPLVERPALHARAAPAARAARAGVARAADRGRVRRRRERRRQEPAVRADERLRRRLRRSRTRSRGRRASRATRSVARGRR